MKFPRCDNSRWNITDLSKMKIVTGKHSQTKRIIQLIFSILALLSGMFTLIFTQSIFDHILKSQLVVREGTATYNAWLETPIPVYTKFFFFHILNEEDFLNNGAKPIVEERGPYTFRQVEKKVDLVWHNNGTLSYRRVKFWYFEPNMSVGNLEDTVTTLNVPVVGAAEYAKDDFMLQWGISDMLSTIEATLFVTKTVRELLFSGYSDPVLDMAPTMNKEEEDDDEYDFWNEEEEYEEEEEEINEQSKKEEDFPLDKFGWFYKRNGTSWYDGDLTMWTGEDDITKLGQIDMWNNRKTTDAFQGECGKVRGSADGLFAPGSLINGEELSIYSTDICRPLNFTNTESTTLHGIQVNHYSMSPTVFSNSSVCQSNSCYNNNLPTGVQNVTQCKVKSPAFVSRPHFYMADNMYKEQFQYGVEPNSIKHGSSFWIEPITSIPIKFEVRLQLNILIKPIKGIEYLFSKLPRIMFPVIWFETTGVLEEPESSSLKLLVKLPTVLMGCGFFSILSGLLMLKLMLICRIRTYMREEDGKTTKEYKPVPVVES